MTEEVRWAIMNSYWAIFGRSCPANSALEFCHLYLILGETHKYLGTLPTLLIQVCVSFFSWENCPLIFCGSSSHVVGNGRECYVDAKTEKGQ